MSYQEDARLVLRLWGDPPPFAADTPALAGALDTYREAFSLGTVDKLWPGDAPRDLELAHHVSATLLAGKARVSKGGNPKLMKPSTWARLDARAREVHRLAAELRQEWEKGMHGVFLHGLRKTHRTWALAAGVLPAAVDKQLGHATQDPAEAFEILRVTAGSRVGRQHYLDAASPLFDARESAAAVRRVLDEALAELRAGGESLLVACRMACGQREARA